MSSEDYLIRYFRQLGNVIAAIFEFRKRKEYSLAIDEVNQTLNSWFRIDEPDTMLTREWIINMMEEPSAGFEAEKSLAELLYQKALVYHEMGNLELARHNAGLSLLLLREIDTLSGEFSVENQLQIAELSNMVAES